jgi:hypothetical protein
MLAVIQPKPEPEPEPPFLYNNITKSYRYVIVHIIFFIECECNRK